MNTSFAPAESSILLWTLGVAIYVLGTHVALAAVRMARRLPEMQPQRGLMLMSALAWGSAITFGFLLGVAGLPLPYTLGFHVGAGLGLWFTSCLLALGLVWLLVHRQSTAVHAAAGAALGVAALALHAGWLASAGLRPGLNWRPEVLAAAALLMAIGLAVAVNTGLGLQATEARLRQRWRVAGTVFAALALLGGQEILLAGLSLPTQVGSVYRHQLSMSLLSLLGGAVVPMVLTVAALDLRFRRQDSRRHHREIDLAAPPPRLGGSGRRRKQRIFGHQPP